MRLSALTVKTPVGNFTMLMDVSVVVIASGFADAAALLKRLPATFHKEEIVQIKGKHIYGEAVRKYFAGDPNALSVIKMKQEGTSFQKKVWKAMSRIKWGKTATYKAIATAVEHPNASRAVGAACGANRLILLIPCHRVLPSSGGIGGYVYGANVKKLLLEEEQ